MAARRWTTSEDAVVYAVFALVVAAALLRFGVVNMACEKWLALPW